jgi:hypothetical protein
MDGESPPTSYPKKPQLSSSNDWRTFIHSGALEGYRLGRLVGADPEQIALNRQAAEKPCPRCGQPRIFRQFYRGDSYRCFSICPDDWYFSEF